MSSYQKKILTLSVLLLFFVVALAYGILFNINRHDKTPINLTVFPGDADITINNESIKPGTIYLEPGSYTIRAARSGFLPDSTTITLDDEQIDVAIILTGLTDEAEEYTLNNKESLSKAYGAAQKAANDIGRIFNTKNPIARHLPYKTFFYSVGYRMDRTDPSGNSIIIEIDASEGYRQAAIYRIRQLGYDPTDFTINFRDYENPFAL